MPANRMSRFEVLIGTWNASGEELKTEASSATTLSATDTYRWLRGQHFIVHEADARFGGAPTRSMEVIGYALQSKKYLARPHHDQGVSEVFDVELETQEVEP